MKSSLIAGFAAGLAVASGGAVALDQLDRPAPARDTPAAALSTRTASTTNADQVYSGAKNSAVYVSADTPEGTATGSGFVISSDGKIITNEHVVDSAQQVTVRIGTSDQARPATVLAANASKDLALLKVDTGGQSLTPLKLADSSKVQVGQTAYAIGNPFGLDSTFTSGIISAVGRDIQAPDGTAIPNVIQTDAAINPGNSGGALLNSRGEVVGVNSQIASANQGTGESGNVGIGFAIPANSVKDFVAHPTSTQQQQSQSLPGWMQ